MVLEVEIPFIIKDPFHTAALGDPATRRMTSFLTGKRSPPAFLVSGIINTGWANALKTLTFDQRGMEAN